MSSKNEKYLPNFVEVFEQKLHRMKKHIKRELDKPKKERSTSELKRWLEEAKRLQKMIKEVKEITAKKCPHCGKVI